MNFVKDALAGAVIVDIGQLSPKEKLKLNQLARQGKLARWRGHWAPVPGALSGIGPLKTCWALPEIRDAILSIGK